MTSELALASALLLVGGGGCGSSGPNPPNGCSCWSQTRDIASFQPQNGTGTVDWGGSMPVVGGSAASDGTCVAVVDLDPVVCGDDTLDFSIRVDCEKPNEPSAGFVVDAGNVPVLGPGDHPVVLTKNYVATPGWPTVTLRVESKTGSLGASPTPDFDEKFLLDFQSATFKASLQFELEASQFKQAQQTCQICAC